MSKRKWPKLFECYVPLYGGRIVLCRTLAEWKQCAVYLRRDVDVSPTGVGAHMMFESETDAVHLVGVFNKDRSTLVHEIAHACFRILDRVGIETPVEDKNEAFFYLLDHLYDKCESQLRKRK
jgi:hypothetical protein